MAMPLLFVFMSLIGVIQGQVDGEWRADTTGKEYYISALIEETEVTWQIARDLCMMNGGELASIHSEEERAFIAQYSSDVGFGGHLWNGLNDVDDWDDVWTWSDGSIGQLLDLWADNNPDQEAIAAMCVWQWANGTDGAVPDGKWHNAHCGTHRGFVCKRTAGVTDPVTDPPTTPVDGFCPNGYFGGAGNKCFKPHYHTEESGKTWEEAVFECRNAPGILPDIASVHTDQEHAIVSSFMQRLPIGMWIGLTQRSDNEPFLWIDNTQYAYQKWAPGEPTHGLEEHCVEMWALYPGLWNNINCGHKRGFVCQTYKDPNNIIPTRNPTSFPCPDGFVSYYYACYKVVNTGKTWSEAKQDCQNMGAMLASSLDMAENAALQVMASQIASPVWTGLNDEDNDNAYKWLDGFLVKYTNWFENEPSKESGGGCVALHVDGFWRDDVCTSVYNYVCKTTTVTPPSTPVHVEGSCPNDFWVDYASDCYYFEKNSLLTKTWPDADADCFFLHEHSTLASIHNELENTFIYDNMKDANQNAHAWIGMYRSTKDDQFRWADFSPVEYSNWADGEPNGNATDSGCVRMYTSQGIEGGIWDDYFCDERAYNQYVCKTPKMPPVTTPTQGPGTCPENWTPLGDYCYHFRPDEFSTWSMAQDDCSRMYPLANVASIHYRAEDEWVRDQMSAASTLPEERSYWIGYIRTEAENDFYWFDGSASIYENWGIGEPNDVGEMEDCAEVAPTGMWNDHSCEIALGYVCKMYKCIGSDCSGENSSQGASDGGGLSGGEVAGVVFGVLFAVLALGLVAVLGLGYFGVISVGPCANRDNSETRRLA